MTYTPPATRFYAHSQLYQLTEDYTVDVDGFRLFLPSGFVFDGASVPSIFWWLINPCSLGLGAAAVHDWLYEHGGQIAVLSDSRPANLRPAFTRADADRFLLHISKIENSWWWRRTYALPFVRLVGRWSWNHAGHTSADLR